MRRLGLAPKVIDFLKGIPLVDSWLETVYERLNTYKSASNPVATEVPKGQWVVHVNSGTNTLNLWANDNGTMRSISATGGPTFKAYRNGDQSITSDGTTNNLVQFQTEIFDTGSLYDNATNYRFTPTTAGYYQVNWNVLFLSTVSMAWATSILRKNGTVASLGGWGEPFTNGGNRWYCSTGSDIVYLNGSTDYIDVVAIASGTTVVVRGENSSRTNFSAVWIRT